MAIFTGFLYFSRGTESNLGPQLGISLGDHRELINPTTAAAQDENVTYETVCCAPTLCTYRMMPVWLGEAS